MEKIKFYSLGSQKLSLLNLDYELDSSKTVVTSPNFERAMSKVIIKDLKSLDSRVEKNIKEINKLLLINEINVQINSRYTSKDINKIIDDIEQIVKTILIEGENNKAGLFSFNKKKKKQRLSEINNLVEMLTKNQNDFISMKNEFLKLEERRKALTNIEDDEEEEEKEDPLERTINFYINKKDLM